MGPRKAYSSLSMSALNDDIRRSLLTQIKLTQPNDEAQQPSSQPETTISKTDDHGDRPEYSNISYWQHRYTSNSQDTVFEWVVTYENALLRSLIDSFINSVCSKLSHESQVKVRTEMSERSDETGNTMIRSSFALVALFEACNRPSSLLNSNVLYRPNVHAPRYAFVLVPPPRLRRQYSRRRHNKFRLSQREHLPR